MYTLGFVRMYTVVFFFFEECIYSISVSQCRSEPTFEKVENVNTRFFGECIYLFHFFENVHKRFL